MSVTLTARSLAARITGARLERSRRAGTGKAPRRRGLAAPPAPSGHQMAAAEGPSGAVSAARSGGVAATELSGAGDRSAEAKPPGPRPAGTGPAGALIADDAVPPAAGCTDCESGMATAEYAIATVAAAGFAGLLVVILRSGEVRELLLGIIRSALSV